jgi:histone H3/H4
MINLVPFILKVLKLVHPECNVTLDAKQELNTILNKLSVYIIKDDNNLKDALSSELYKHAIQSSKEGTKQYINPIMKVYMIRKIARYYDLKIEASEKMICCVIEYLLSEILELTCVLTRSKKKCRIKYEHVLEAIKEDKDELYVLYKKISSITLKSKSKRRSRSKSRSRKDKDGVFGFGKLFGGGIEESKSKSEVELDVLNKKEGHYDSDEYEFVSRKIPKYYPPKKGISYKYYLRCYSNYLGLLPDYNGVEYDYENTTRYCEVKNKEPVEKNGTFLYKIYVNGRELTVPESCLKELTEKELIKLKSS